MKRIRYFLFILAISTPIISSCRKENLSKAQESENPGNILHTSTSAISTEKGEIGLVIDVRELAFLGYKPIKVKLDFKTALNEFSTLLKVDKFTNVASLKIPVKDLTARTLASFEAGVQLSIKVLDTDNRELEGFETEKTIINASNARIICQTDKPGILTPLSINSNVQHLIQIDREGGLVLDVSGSQLATGAPIFTRKFNAGKSTKQHYYLIQFDDSTFAIKAAHTNLYLKIEKDGLLYQEDEVTKIDQLENKNKFVLHQTDDGWIKIRPVNKTSFLKFGNGVLNSANATLLVIPSVITTDPTAANTPDAKFRIVPANFEWVLADFDTKLTAPVIRSAKKNIAALENVNHFSKAGTNTIAKNGKAILSSSSGWEESMKFYSGLAEGKSVIIGTEVNSRFFSAEADANFETIAGLEHQVTTRNAQDRIKRNEIEVFPHNMELTSEPNSTTGIYGTIRIFKNTKLQAMADNTNDNF